MFSLGYNLVNHHADYFALDTEAVSNQITAANPNVNSSPMTESKVSLVDQVFIVSATLMLKYSLTSQKPPSLTWEKMSAPAPVAMASNSGRTPGLCKRMGADDAGGRSHGDRGGSGGQTNERGDQPSQQEQRYMGVQCNPDNRLRNAAILKNTSESAARSDHQSGIGRGRQAFIGEFQNRLPVVAAHFAQRDKADQDRDQQRDIGTAQQVQHTVSHGAGRCHQAGPASG